MSSRKNGKQDACSAICIRQLNEVFNGQLRFGSMPPLGGALEPIGRIIPENVSIQKGDVVAFGGTLNSDRAHCVEEAFAQGALGVLANRPVVPWDGCFSVQVVKVREAIVRFADWQRRRCLGPVVAIVDDAVDSRALKEIDQFVELSQPLPPEVVQRELLWKLLHLDVSARGVSLQITTKGVCKSSATILRADVVVVPFDRAFEASQTEQNEAINLLLENTNRGCHVILDEPDREFESLADRHGVRVVVADETSVRKLPPTDVSANPLLRTLENIFGWDQAEEEPLELETDEHDVVHVEDAFSEDDVKLHKRKSA